MTKCIGRRQPYTETGIRRVACGVRGCRAKGHAQWQCCANGNRWVPLCKTHDTALNRVALAFIRHPEAEALMDAYVKREG
jgi:hypothetical protein